MGLASGAWAAGLAPGAWGVVFAGGVCPEGSVWPVGGLVPPVVSGGLVPCWDVVCGARPGRVSFCEQGPERINTRLGGLHVALEPLGVLAGRGQTDRRFEILERFPVILKAARLVPHPVLANAQVEEEHGEGDVVIKATELIIGLGVGP